MSRFRLTIGDAVFEGRFEPALAPLTVAAVLRALPLVNKAIHVRWSGEAVWVPMGDRNFGIGPENATSYPAPGQILLYPAAVSETELLVAYGPVRFASKAGQLAGNHFATIDTNLDALGDAGRSTLWLGARDLTLDLIR